MNKHDQKQKGNNNENIRSNKATDKDSSPSFLGSLVRGIKRLWRFNYDDNISAYCRSYRRNGNGQKEIKLPLPESMILGGKDAAYLPSAANIVYCYNSMQAAMNQNRPSSKIGIENGSSKISAVSEAAHLYLDLNALFLHRAMYIDETVYPEDE